MSLLSRLFRRRQEPSKPLRFVDWSTFDGPIYAVGDVHGRLDLLKSIEAKIAQDATTDARIILLGDVIDRGPESAALLDYLMHPPADPRLRRVTLRGNHEDMFLKFIDAPGANRKWLDFGGAATMASYGAFGDADSGFAVSDRRLEQIVAAHIPRDHRDFLEALPFWAAGDRTVFCHAGIDPERAMVEQTPRDLLWGSPARLDGANLSYRVVHGHVDVERPLVNKARINVDTGAWKSGILTAVCLTKGAEPRFLQTSVQTSVGTGNQS